MRTKLKKKPTHAANTNIERGDQLMKISLHNRYDKTKISKHVKSDPPRTAFHIP